MGYAITVNNGKVHYGVNHYTADKVEDLKKIPVGAPGSTVFCIENSQHYMLDTQGYWRKVDLGGNGSGSSADGQNVEMVYEGGIVTGGGS